MRAEAIAADLYAIIEIGNSGVRCSIVQLVPGEGGVNELDRRARFEPENPNAGRADAIPAVASVVRASLRRITEEYAVAPEDVFILLSSSVAGLPHRQALVEAITGVTGQKVDVVDADAEARLTFEGIVPKKRRNQVVVIDIGSGNTKGAYLDRVGSSESFATFEIPWGTKTFTRVVTDRRGDGDFVTTARTVRRELVTPMIRGLVDKRPGLQNLPRVYLSGGIVWATTTMVRPAQQLKSWVRINPEDFRTVQTRASRNPERLFEVDLGRIGDQAVRSQVIKDIDLIQRSIFTRDQMMGGTELLLALSEELGLATRPMFFSRNAQEAWVVGYLQSKITIENEGSDEEP